MSGFGEKLASLSEYLGLNSSSYYHKPTPVSYEPNDPTAYYLDQSARAAYKGPFDKNGVPMYPHTGGIDYLPVHIILYALGHLELYRRNKTGESLNRLLQSANWLVASQQPDGSWLSPFGMPKFGLPGPWRSAMTQGMAISLLLRAREFTSDDHYTESAVRALAPFHQEVADGGVTSYHEAGPFYEEYPCRPHRHVLNGFLFAMWGLYDLVRFRDNHEARTLWRSGLGTIAHWLPRYDMGFWSLYHIPSPPPNPATVKYHRLHINQLAVMHELTGEVIFEEYRNRWQGYLDSRFKALRTLPLKLRWLVASRRAPTDPESPSPRDP